MGSFETPKITDLAKPVRKPKPKPPLIPSSKAAPQLSPGRSPLAPPRANSLATSRADSGSDSLDSHAKPLGLAALREDGLLNPGGPSRSATHKLAGDLMGRDKQMANLKALREADNTSKRRRPNLLERPPRTSIVGSDIDPTLADHARAKPSNPWWKAHTFPPMDAGGAASNRRNADYLKTVGTIGDLPRYTAEALETHPNGMRDVADLLKQVEKADPERAKELADKTFKRLSEGRRRQLQNMERSTQKNAATQSKKPPALKGKPPALKGTTFFGGAGLNGNYIQDMVKALDEAGIKGARAADPKKWSSGMPLDALSVFSERSRDSDESDLTAMGKKGDQFNLVGYSYGGLQAAQGAIDYAEKGGKVDNLILIGTPVDAEFLQQLKKHPNIGKVEVIDLSEHGDPIKAGMGTADLIMSLPKLGKDYYTEEKGTQRGHFYYSGEGSESRTRRRALANRLRELGVR
jgi:hypothetical protein